MNTISVSTFKPTLPLDLGRLGIGIHCGQSGYWHYKNRKETVSMTVEDGEEISM